MAAGGKAINLGELAIAIALKTGAFGTRIKASQKQLKDHGKKKIQGTSKDYDKLPLLQVLLFLGKLPHPWERSSKHLMILITSMVGLRHRSGNRQQLSTRPRI